MIAIATSIQMITNSGGLASARHVVSAFKPMAITTALLILPTMLFGAETRVRPCRERKVLQERQPMHHFLTQHATDGLTEQYFVVSPGAMLQVLTGTTRHRDLDRRVLQYRSAFERLTGRAESIDALLSERRLELHHGFDYSQREWAELIRSRRSTAGREKVKDHAWGYFSDSDEHLEQNFESLDAEVDAVFSGWHVE
jgi:hypothetical protein